MGHRKQRENGGGGDELWGFVWAILRIKASAVPNCFVREGGGGIKLRPP